MYMHLAKERTDPGTTLIVNILKTMQVSKSKRSISHMRHQNNLCRFFTNLDTILQELGSFPINPKTKGVSKSK